MRNIYGATDNYEFGRELDEVITKRNSKVHYKSVKDLDDDVQLGKSWLQKYSAIQAAYKNQCTTIEYYEPGRLFSSIGFQR